MTHSYDNELFSDHGNESDDIIETSEYSVDIREIHQSRKSHAYKQSLWRFRAALRGQLERVQRKEFDSGDSSADETTSDWLERLEQGKYRASRAIEAPPDQDATDTNCPGEQDKIEANPESFPTIAYDHLIALPGFGSSSLNDLARLTRLQEVFENSVSATALVTPGSSPSSRRSPEDVALGPAGQDDERMLEDEEGNAGTIVADVIQFPDEVPADEYLGEDEIIEQTIKEEKLTQEYRDKGHQRQVHVYKKDESTGIDSSVTTTRTVEIVEEDRVMTGEDYSQDVTEDPMSGFLSPIVTSLLKKQLDKLMSSPHDGEEDDKPAKRRNVCEENDRRPILDARATSIPADVKMFGKLVSGKRRFTKRIPRQVHLKESSSSSSSSQGDVQDKRCGLDKLLLKLTSAGKDRAKAPAFGENDVKSHYRQTTRVVKKRARRKPEVLEDEFPERKRARRSCTTDVVTEVTREQKVLRQDKKGHKYTARSFYRKRYQKHSENGGKRPGRVSHEMGPNDIKQILKKNLTSALPKTPATYGAPTEDGKRKTSSPDQTVPLPRAPALGGQSTFPAANDRDVLSWFSLKIVDISGRQLPQRASVFRAPLLKLKGELHRKYLERRSTWSSFTDLMGKTSDSLITGRPVTSILVFFALAWFVIVVSLATRMVFFCNETDRCWSCDLEYAFSSFVRSHTTVLHVRHPPI